MALNSIAKKHVDVSLRCELEFEISILWFNVVLEEWIIESRGKFSFLIWL